ncbi:protein timeless homolog [Spea bombifrons]|uniref:protein timeless homolog n=1 Tax=Spea bombifrons TaxID=233779 RepID=UPI00234A0E9C|nr:protein timeless homolog [Spea bombifrons]XP_053311650.1 protein timeless homolog [Spea bombifrons]
MDLYMMNCELLATCSALGYLEGETYHKEPDCLESVKDLIRYLRHEDDSRDIRQQLGAAQILQNDLIPLVIQHHSDKLLFDAVIRLMVNLTQPALLCFGKVPQDPTFRHHYLQVVSYLQAYKEAFASEKLLGVLSEKLYDLLQLDWEQRGEEHNLLIERILLLVRNILHVPADPEEGKSVDDDASTHDRVLWAVHMSGMDDLVKFLASSETEQQWSMHVLETVSLMFRDQNAEHLAATGQARSVTERTTDVKDLEILRQREIAERKNRVFQRGTRHSRFGGSYVIQGMKSIADRDIIYHKGLHNYKNYSHDSGKEVKRVPKRRQQARDTEPPRRSALNVRLFLKEFCIDFLENCYNRLMYIVKDHLIREKAQQHDETYYLWSMAFFMAFNRLYKFRPELVSETVSIRTFHFIEQNLTNYYEMMLTDKKEASSWARRMHLALKAYQELLTTVHEMDHSKDETVRESSTIIKNNIFYLMEYRELFLALFRKFDETKQPRSFLKDLVETAHLFLKMLERFCKGKRTVVVQNRKIKRKKKKSVRRSTDGHRKTPEELEETWKSVSEKLKDCVMGSQSLPEAVVPFDAASEIPVEEQRTEALVRIQDGLLSGKAPESLVLLRSAREVWPEGDVFGSPEMEHEEEVELMKQILLADLPRSSQGEAEDLMEEEEEEEEAEEEELTSVQVSEKEFNFIDYMKRFANSNVVKTYVLLLKNYQQNSAHTNHCVVKMLHRIAYDLKMEALLFQLSVFCLFNRIMNDPAAGVYKELVGFSKYIVNKFFALAATNNKAYVELLFWKNTNVVREMTEGYGKTAEGGSEGNHKRLKWTPEEEEELRGLYLQYKEIENVDVVDTILANLKPGSRTRKQIINHLVQMGLADSAKDFKKEVKGTRIVLWTEDQELELQRLYELFQESDDILGNIMKNITAKRSKARIIEKLISMGLVSERKELYKKRKRKGKCSGMSEEEFLHDLGIDGKGCDVDEVEEEEEDDEEESEEEEEWESAKESKPKEKLDKRKSESFVDKKLQSLVQRLQREGFSSPILWLQNCLNRAAEDKEEDGSSQSIPLVPLTEENEDAMENKTFQKLLKSLGVRPPSNEQESFWRIPGKLSPAHLRKVASSLDHPSPDGTIDRPSDSEDQDPSLEQRAVALRALLLVRKKKAGTTLPEELEEQNQHTDIPTEPEVQSNRPKTVTSRARLVDSEEEEELATDQEINDPDQQMQDASLEPELRSNRLKMKRSRLVDSDDEEPVQENQGDTALEPGDTRSVSDAEPEEDIRPTKRRRFRIDDEEED